MTTEISLAPNYRALFESTPGLYVVMTPGFEIVAASDAYLQATMRSRDELVGRTLFDVFFDEPDASAARTVRKLTASVKRVLADKRPDVMAFDRQGERCWKRVNSPVLGASGEVIYIMHHVEDVTESKDDFLAMLGHELRNPLAAIASATEVLKRAGATSGVAGQSFAVIERQVRHLERLVDDLVDAARVQGGEVTPATRRPMRTAAARRRVLVIEDNDDARDMLKTLLVLEGHEVLEARDGADGVRMLMTERPEVALIDIGLPVMDGYEVARTVRSLADHATLLVALTGYGQAEDRQRSYDAGFDDFVVKPVDPARLTQILGRLILDVQD